MVYYLTGDIFKSNAQIITNPVNCVGVMGKGLALVFKKKFPEMFTDYQSRCENGEVRIGKPYIWEDDRAQILNFPTKRHWREPSRLSDIEEGLKYLSENYAQMGISSLALPALGSGLGGLKWDDVKNLIDKYLGTIQALDVYVHTAVDSKTLLESDDIEGQIIKPSHSDGYAAQQSLL